uniref:Uncharacterized protein n=1 Tax=mine drainage metagenome TaxID=410659 RepID=E6PUY5_9ZZZZ
MTTWSLAQCAHLRAPQAVSRTRSALVLARRFSTACTSSSSWPSVKDGTCASRTWNDSTFMVNFSYEKRRILGQINTFREQSLFYPVIQAS